MAKIGELEVGTIKIDDGAVTGCLQAFYSFGQTGNDTKTITVPNSYGNPIALFWRASGAIWGNFNSNNEHGASASINVKKGTTSIYNPSRSVAWNGSAALNWDGSILDLTPAATGQEYSIQAIISGQTSSFLAGGILAMYIKK